MNLSKRLWTAFKLGMLSIFNVSRKDYEEILYTRNDDYKALKSDWRFLVDDADILESLYKEIENDYNSI